MSILDDRLRLGRRQCQQWRSHLAGLESLAQRLRADERRLRAEIELGVAGRLSPEAGAGQPGFAAEPAGELLGRHGKLVRSVAAVDTQIAEVGAALGVAEQALQGQELAAAQRTVRAGGPESRRTRRDSVAAAADSTAGPDRGS
jgi:hypothetical protein